MVDAQQDISYDTMVSSRRKLKGIGKQRPTAIA